jgi:hypothetical protein
MQGFIYGFAHADFSISGFDAVSKTIIKLLVAGLGFGLGLAGARGTEVTAQFLGANSCASSSCHGGGGANQNQFLVWSLKDYHSQRPVATLTTARSLQIARALQISDPTVDARCTTCHAPLAAVPDNLRGTNFSVGEGVSCESCHGPAENWLRAHTRADWTRANRTAAGMRDLQNLYVRANTCVACHQVVSTSLLQAGHPELIFELDGQSVAEPKHWRPEKNGNGCQGWFVGQAVALRELSWQLAQETQPDAQFATRQAALLWLMQKVAPIGGGSMPVPNDASMTPAAAQKWADDLARAASANWTPENSRSALKILADTAPDLQNVPENLAARRAERLVLALDRLLPTPANPAADAALNRLFKLAQSIPDFQTDQFTAALADFSKAVNAQ